MTKEMAFSILRQIMFVLGGTFIAKGWLDAPMLDAIIGALLILANSAWALYERRKAGLLASAYDAGGPGTEIYIQNQRLANATPREGVKGPLDQ